MKHIKDPIHGYIDIPEEELSLINSSEFQRLRQIKQLGLSDTVYPSATHTRFTHSIGVMHVAGQLAESIGADDDIIRLNKIAGLLHDTGHLPFSHTLESILNEREGLTHEDISCDYVDTLATKESTTFPVEPDYVKSLIKGESHLINTISGDIDADRIDYLLRDSYHTGIDFGNFEYDTLLKFAKLINGTVGFDHKSLQSVESLLDARMKMNYSVYSHDTVSIIETMLKRSVEYYLDNTDTTILDLVGKTDWELHSDITNSNVSNSKELFNRIQNRNLYKTCFLAPLQDASEDKIKHISQFLDNVKEHEKNIAEIADIDRKYVFMNPPKFKSNEKINIPINTPLREIKSLEDISSKPNALRESSMHHENINIFCPPEYMSEVYFATKTYFETIDEINILNYV